MSESKEQSSSDCPTPVDNTTAHPHPHPHPRPHPHPAPKEDNNTPPSGARGLTVVDNPNMVSYSNVNTQVIDQADYVNHFASAPLSPSYHHPHLQPTYYYQPTPASPATPSIGNGYDVQSILGQQHSGTANVFMRQQYPVIPPLSPGEPGNNGLVGSMGMEDVNVNLSMGTVPPASPLFPGAIPVFGTGPEQLDTGRSMVTPTSPSLQYLTGPPPSPIISYGGIYANNMQPGSPEPRNTWNDRTLHHQMYPTSTPTPSPHIQSLQYQQTMNQTHRTTSFDGELLPPSALEDSGPAVYATSGATLFSQQQPWGGGYNPNNNPYGNAQPPPPTSALQQHPSQMRGSPQRTRQHPRPGPNPYYPAATPGPPIQTTHHNKGPEGANLFIFHIPNHFTNLDMWHLFCHYGNLLSVRIMVEKDTGRSRGFGFVSYDSPDAAAVAIKELNGFVIGNKRLKVQHKQIRQGESAPPHDAMRPPHPFPEGNGMPHIPVPGELPPSHQVGGDHGPVPGYVLPPNVGADPNLVVPVTVTESELKGTDRNVSQGSILDNLDSIADALPSVSK